MDEHKLFDIFTASTKVGSRVKALVNFLEVPQGSVGTIVRAQPDRNGYLLVIEWSAARREGKPQVFWFNRSEYEEYLAEMR